MLTDIIPAPWRKTIYVAYASAIVLLGALQVGFSEAGLAAPTWHGIASEVVLYLGAAVGLVASGNVTTRGRHAAPENDDQEVAE